MEVSAKWSNGILTEGGKLLLLVSSLRHLRHLIVFSALLCFPVFLEIEESCE